MRNVYGKDDFVEICKNLEVRLLLDHRDNYVRNSNMMSNIPKITAKKF